MNGNLTAPVHAAHHNHATQTGAPVSPMDEAVSLLHSQVAQAHERLSALNDRLLGSVARHPGPADETKGGRPMHAAPLLESVIVAAENVAGLVMRIDDLLQRLVV